MEILNKENIDKFINDFHSFHDSSITHIAYDVTKSQIGMFVDVNSNADETNFDEVNKKKLRLLFKDVEKCNNKEIFSWNYIDKAYIKYIKLDNREYLCFASDEEDPFVYIVCDTIAYEIVDE